MSAVAELGNACAGTVDNFEIESYPQLTNSQPELNPMLIDLYNLLKIMGFSETSAYPQHQQQLHISINKNL